MPDPEDRFELVSRLVSVGEELNSLAELRLPPDEALERWTALTSYRASLWRALGIEESAELTCS